MFWDWDNQVTGSMTLIVLGLGKGRSYDTGALQAVFKADWT